MTWFLFHYENKRDSSCVANSGHYTAAEGTKLHPFYLTFHIYCDRVDGVMDTTGQGWLPVNIFVVVNGVGVAFLNVMLDICVRFQMSR
ncbi:hypothetical protein OUZ56_012515 [Daphnia magna]|uniref:Transmembrane protein n=1 Tax=Daphnia magna TaxID=35525 RepID=A0ABQ9Z3G0_9CRUS|nr:hypothetical protein OUZ56_012515 [Daphnia magna]